VVTVLQSDGKTPAAGLQLRASGRDFHKDVTTDANGVVVFDPAPAAEIRLHSARPYFAMGPVRVPAGRTEHAVILTLPADKPK
jgi:hypothetical protein